jgi:ribonuclease T2
MHLLRTTCLTACVLWATASALAHVAMTGSFTATKSCPALQSIRKSTNPGEAMIAAGTAYRLKGRNKEQATHYQIEVPGAAPLERWVTLDCGTVAGGEGAGGGNQPMPGDKLYILAMSWQPAFCEGLPDKKECQAQTPRSFEASHFTLHGLWPQPRNNIYCGVPRPQVDADAGHRWEELPKVELSAETRKGLDEVMPGTQSFLERHEWTKHGTCYASGSAEPYFKDALRIMTAINQSPMQAFVAANVGKTIQSSELRVKFDEAFGPGAGDRLRVACKPDGGRQLIVEITLGLGGDIPAGIPVKELIAGSRPTDPGCPSGIIDPVGLQ